MRSRLIDPPLEPTYVGKAIGLATATLPTERLTKQYKVDNIFPITRLVKTSIAKFTGSQVKIVTARINALKDISLSLIKR